ncbi:hypothetical protein [Actinokineospora bangkokensis]|uniref:J domain-containing protein n=1 Tax=Actinokineospora bangkokensis TaxID=1193682 RepID=A0A1Q9LSK8_9PSEU|nr:hypothetical protein [Actinokineospora bangkokensis]OLR94990.1 hypothetical protein BJP25_08465 [Actinokineospora bangkokensis]
MSGRAEFRAFVKRAHPDAGGDHDEFVAGLARFRAESGVDDQGAGGGNRFDGPVVFATGPRGVRGLVDRVSRWHSRRFRKPRVR